MSSPQLMVVFGAPRNLRREFFTSGFRPYGRVPGNWCLDIDPASVEARDLEYEVSGVGLRVVWRAAS